MNYLTHILLPTLYSCSLIAPAISSEHQRSLPSVPTVVTVDSKTPNQETVLGFQDNAQTTPVERWAKEFLSTVDAGNPNDIVAYFTKDIQLRMGNQDPIQGRSSVRESFAQIAKQYDTNHQIQGVWTGTWEEDGRTGDVVSIEVQVTYTLLDGQAVTVPCNTTLKREGDLIRDYQIFIDFTPVQEANQS